MLSAPLVGRAAGLYDYPAGAVSSDQSMSSTSLSAGAVAK